MYLPDVSGTSEAFELKIQPEAMEAPTTGR